MIRKLQSPNVIVVLIDAARPDYFSCYGSGLNTTPNIDKIAQKGIIFENVISTAPWTIPSCGSIFTGLYPNQHKATWETLRLKEGIPTIFDIFAQSGYDSVAVSANGLIVSPYNMFGQKTKIVGPEFHNDPNITSFNNGFDYHKTDSQHIAGYIAQYLEEAPLDKPQLIYLHFYDLHAKYKAREPFYSWYVNVKQDQTLNKVGDFYNLHFQEMNDEIEITDDMISALRAFYAARLAMIDADLGKVFKKFDETGLMDNSIVVITSDHGDVLGDHKKPSFHHQFSIYNSLLKIPLVFSWKGIEFPKRINIPNIQNIDILPTLLSLCGIKNPALLNKSPGIGLSDYIFNGNMHPPRQYAISMYESPLRFILRNKKKINTSYIHNLMAIQDADCKLIFSDKNGTELYRIRDDNNEQRNISDRFPQKVAELKSAFYEIIGKCKDKENIYIGNNLADEEKMLQRLKALGYIE